MPTWKPIVGKAFSPAEFSTYCGTLTWTAWRPSFLVMHNTAIPTLSEEPNGFTSASMNGFVSYYRDTMHWSAGPHLFVDDHQIWVFTPLTTPGVHSPSWNHQSLGMEMLGNYDSDAFNSGRGLAVHQHAVAAMTTLFGIFGWPADNSHYRLHKEDPLTTHKSCPGSNVQKSAVLGELQVALLQAFAGEHNGSGVSRQANAQ